MRVYDMGSHFFLPKYYGYAHALTPVCIDATFYVRVTVRSGASAAAEWNWRHFGCTRLQHRQVCTYPGQIYHLAVQQFGFNPGMHIKRD